MSEYRALQQVQAAAGAYARRLSAGQFTRYTVARFARDGRKLEYWRIHELALARETFDLIRSELRAGECCGLYGSDDQIILWAEV